MTIVCPQTLDHTPQAQWRQNISTDFFDEPECLSSDKENIPPIESITPPSLKDLSLEEAMTENDTEATCWDANVVKKHHDFAQGKFSLSRPSQHTRTIRT